LGKFSDKINLLIETALRGAKYSSAGGANDIRNYFIEFESPMGDANFEDDIENIVKEKSGSGTEKSSEGSKLSTDATKKKIQDTELKVDGMLSGNLGDLGKMSTEQFGNIRQVATNPFGFMTRTLLRKLKTGAGILFIIAIAVEVAKFLMDEMFKPGRAFDQRFREQINHQIIQFTSRKEQEELRAGYKSVITTTMGGLRGGILRGQIGGNFYSSPFTNGTIYDNHYVRSNFQSGLKDMRTKDVTQTPNGEAHASNRNRKF
jgi:hypothetical protein